MVGSLTPEAAVSRLGEQSDDLVAAILIDGEGRLSASAGAEPETAAELGERATTLFDAAEAAGTRAGLGTVERVEVSRPRGGVFGVRGRDSTGRPWTLVAITGGGALPSLVHYDLRMALRSIGEPS